MDWKLDPESRRDFLKKGVAVGSVAAGSSTAITGEVTAATVSETEWKQSDSYEYHYVSQKYEDNLGSGLEHVEQNPGGTHSFRIAGDYCIVTKPEEELPPDVFAHILSTGVKLENESDDDVSIFTSKNSDEIAFNPVGKNSDDGNADAFSTATGALSLAASAAKMTVPGLALSAASLAAGMVGLLDDGDQGGGVYEWNQKTPRNDDRRGGHHVDFKVEEKGNEGSITVASKTEYTSNTWRLTFSGNGLTDVTEI